MAGALQVSKSDIISLRQRAENLARRAKAALHKADSVVTTGLRTVVVGGTAFGFGVLQGYNGGIEIVGVPLELLTGLGAHVAAFAGVGGGLSPQLHAMGDGAIAAWATTTGRRVGLNWRSGGSPGAKAAGLFTAEEHKDEF